MTPSQRSHGETEGCVACDYPVCIGGECAWECERQDKHEEWLKEEALSRAPSEDKQS